MGNVLCGGALSAGTLTELGALAGLLRRWWVERELKQVEAGGVGGLGKKEEYTPWRSQDMQDSKSGWP